VREQGRHDAISSSHFGVGCGLEAPHTLHGEGEEALLDGRALEPPDGVLQRGNGRGKGTGQLSWNYRSRTGISSWQCPRLIWDHVLNRCQKAVPSATPWLSDMATKTPPSASSVT
jgi:hypothetical protein